MSLFVPRAAAADADQTVEAEQLFRDGRALLKAGKLAAACEALEASQRLGPAVATLLNLADCRERAQQFATAWSVYLQAASKARGDLGASRMAAVARDRAAALEPRLSFLTISVPDDSRVEGLAILRNGVPLDPAVWNRSIPVDGGPYVITAKAPGLEPWSYTVEIQRERDRQSVTVPRFQVAPAARPAVATAPALGARAERPAPGPPPPRNLLPIGLGTTALAAVGIAAGLELSGRAAYDRYQRAPTAERYDEANTKHHLAQGLALGGVVCGAAALYVWYRARPVRPDQTVWRPVVGPGLAAVAVLGAF